MTILWIDDRPETISYEIERLKTSNDNLDINVFETIDLLLGYLETHNIEPEESIFIIDAMLVGEDRIVYKDINISIPEDLMAGVDLFKECISIHFPKVPTILYTSRGGEDQEVFNSLQKTGRIGEDLFVIGKGDYNTEFSQTLKKLGVETWL